MTNTNTATATVTLPLSTLLPLLRHDAEVVLTFRWENPDGTLCQGEKDVVTTTSRVDDLESTISIWENPYPFGQWRFDGISL